MASAHPLSSVNKYACSWCSSPLVLGPDGHESGPVQRYNLFLDHTSLEFRVIDMEIRRWRTLCHFPVFCSGCGSRAYVSHDRRARCNHVNVQKKGFTPINLYAAAPGVITPFHSWMLLIANRQCVIFLKSQTLNSQYLGPKTVIQSWKGRFRVFRNSASLLNFSCFNSLMPRTHFERLAVHAKLLLVCS